MSNQRDDEFEPGNRQHAGQDQQGGAERLGDSLSGSITTEEQQGGGQHQSGNPQKGEQGGDQQQQRADNQQSADRQASTEQGTRERAMPTLPDEAQALTPEELRLMADTMPGDGPGGD